MAIWCPLKYSSDNQKVLTRATVNQRQIHTVENPFISEPDPRASAGLVRLPSLTVRSGVGVVLRLISVQRLHKGARSEAAIRTPPFTARQ
jgi:hypothetical protein